MKDYYRILEVSEYASEEVIKNAYKTLSKKYHPDLHKNQYKVYEQHMKDINEAYNVLIDEQKRQEYNSLLKQEQEREKYLSTNYYQEQNENFEESNPLKRKIINSLNFNKIIIFATIISIIMLIILLNIILKVFDVSSLNIKNIDIGVDKNYIIQHYGDPINTEDNLLIYDNFVITTKNNKITGWIDIYNELDLGKTENVKEKDIRIGDTIEKIIDKKGNPNVLLENIAIYDNIVLYIENGYINKIEKIE